MSFSRNSFLWHCCLSYPTVLQSGSNSVVVEAFSASATSFRAWHQTQPHLPESHDRPQASKSSVYTWSIPENGFTTTCCASKQFKTPTCHNFDSSKLKSEAPVPRKEMGTRVVHVEGTNLGSVNEIHGSNAYVSKLRLANIIESYPYSGLLHVDNHQLVPNIVPQLVVPEDFLPDMRWPPQSLPLHWPAPPPKKN